MTVVGRNRIRIDEKSGNLEGIMMKMRTFEVEGVEVVITRGA